MADYQFSIQNGSLKGVFTSAGINFGDIDEIVYDGETSLNDAWAGHLGNAHKTYAEQQPSSGADTQGSLTSAVTVPDPDPANAVLVVSPNGALIRVTDDVGATHDKWPPTGFEATWPTGPNVLKGAVTSYAPSQLTDSVFDANDTIMGVKPRDRWKLRTRRYFFTSDVIGFACKMDGSTTSGSATVTVPDTSRLMVGQAVSGTGIPTGAKIAAIKRKTKVTDSATDVSLRGTEIVLTHKATASGTPELTFTGSAVVASAWLDELDAEAATLSLFLA